MGMCILGTSSLFDPVFIISTGGKETPAQVFFCEILKIFKNPFFYRTHPMTASVSKAFWLENEVLLSWFFALNGSLSL